MHIENGTIQPSAPRTEGRRVEQKRQLTIAEDGLYQRLLPEALKKISREDPSFFKKYYAIINGLASTEDFHAKFNQMLEGESETYEAAEAAEKPNDEGEELTVMRGPSEQSNAEIERDAWRIEMLATALKNNARVELEKLKGEAN